MHQWHFEIKRQLDRWQKDKEEQRIRMEPRSNMVHGERPMYEQVNSSHDSLDLMRAAPRPKHPYASDFRSRSRSSSRVHSRSTSVSSTRDGDASVISDEAFKQLEATVSRRGGTAAYSMPPERDHMEVLVQSGAIEALRARSQTQDGSSFVLWRNQILPPQPPPPQFPQPPIPTSAIRSASTKLPERRMRARQSSTSTLASAESDSSSNRVGIIPGGRRPSVPDLSYSSRTYVPHSGSATGREPPERNPMFGTSTLGVPAEPRVRSLSNPNVQPIPSHPHTMDGVLSLTIGRSTTKVPQHQPLSHPHGDRSGSQRHRKRSSGSSFDSLESPLYGGGSSPLTPFSSREGYSLHFSGNTASSAHPYAAPPLASAPLGQTPSGQKNFRPPNLRLVSSSSDIRASGVTSPLATSPRYRPMPVPHQPNGSPGVMSGAASSATSPTTIATSSRLPITVHYGTDHKFILGFLTSTPFEEVVDKMRKKIRICTSSDANGPLRMYYGDDRGGRTLLRSAEDYSGALDVVRTRLARGNPSSPGLLVVWVQPDV